MKNPRNSKEYVLAPDELRKLQLVLVEMLEEIDRICKKNGIKYNIFAGTLLGAVRHKGFIPWDDDLDIAVLREEYYKLREACKRDLDETRFFFQDNTTDPHYSWGYARIRYKNTEFVRLGQEHMKMKTGIFLDIFPLDAVPDNKALWGPHCFYCFLIRKFLYAESGAVNGKTAFSRGVYRLMNLVPRRFAFMLLNGLALGSMRKKSKNVRIISFPLPKRRNYGMNRKWFEDLADIEFEGMTFPGTKDWDGFLSYYYGSYMLMPPPEKRHWHPAAKFRLPERK